MLELLLISETGEVDAAIKLEAVPIEALLFLSLNAVLELQVVARPQPVHFEVGGDAFVFGGLSVCEIDPIQMLQDARDVAVGSVEIVAVAEEVPLLNGLVVLGQVHFVHAHLDVLAHVVCQVRKEDQGLVEELLGDVGGRVVVSVQYVVGKAALLLLICL